MYEVIQNAVEEMEYWPLDVNEETIKYSEQVLGDIEAILEFTGANVQGHVAELGSFFPKLMPVLCTRHLCCAFCVAGTNDQLYTLRRRDKLQTICLPDSDFQWAQAYLAVAHCTSCKAEFFPDKIVYKDAALGYRVQ
ncbi:hypothetical protein K435DRAFT_848911 [Dendrothele bispora CBS 962.96]|uniref:CxC5 like cysteine cluster associated with KDZ domain-containing protein n=1 Tax=Dendrothele bispora (strain CBS 962.96) TaxID=1314807 RepID=A0A4S8MUU9_DENBC|nr:hypothetical protein K435DRAFT_848911 [Dendrothele bispora CBS 962.96]